MEEARVGTSGEKVAKAHLANPTVNIRVVLALLWVCHFLLWTFGDMLTLLQEMEEPITDSLILFVAPTTAIVQASMVVANLDHFWVLSDNTAVGRRWPRPCLIFQRPI